MVATISLVTICYHTKLQKPSILSGYFWWKKLVKYSLIQLLWERGPLACGDVFSSASLHQAFWVVYIEPSLWWDLMHCFFLLLFVYDLSCSTATTALHTSWVRQHDWHRLFTAHVSSTGTCHWGALPITNRSWGSMPWGWALEKVLIYTSFTIGKVAKCV